MASTKNDVEMKDTADKQVVEEDPEVKKRRVAKETFALLVSDFISNISILQRGVLQQDDRLIGRAIRQTFHLRKKYSKRLLENVVNKVLTSESDRKFAIQGFLSLVKPDDSSNEMDIEEPISSLPSPAVPLIGAEEAASTPATAAAAAEDQAAKQKQKQLAQLSATEVDVLIQLVITVLLIDKKQISEAVKCSTDLLNYVAQFNRRTLNALGARVYFYYSRSYELNKEFSGTRALLLNALRNASLRHDSHGQSMLVNLLLRNYINDNLYDQANKLLSKTPALDFRSNSQHARFFYYKGRIKSIQLDYSEAYECFMNALRKAPSTTAKGFRTSSQKFAIIVKLLMGEIPERSVFAQQGLKKELKPYFELSKHVRVGDLAAFRDVVSQYGDVYKKDKTYTLIQRIRQNVIRTGLKKISLSYSRISFVDICEKLHLDKPEDVECIVAKAIKDGIIDATIDHDGGFIQSKETVDVYSTSEPLEQFHKRISYCLKVHNECVQAMRFPPDAYKRVKSELEGADERNIRTEELAEELADEDDEGDF